MRIVETGSDRSIRLTIVLLVAASSLAGCGGGDGGPIDPGPNPLPSPNALRLGDSEGAPGSTVQLVLSLENVVDLSGLQFDLICDPAVLTITGAAVTGRSAGFETAVNVDGDTAHILLVDLQGTALIDDGNGAVVTVSADVSSGGTTQLLVDQASGVEADGTTLSIGGSSATFTVR